MEYCLQNFKMQYDKNPFIYRKFTDLFLQKFLDNVTISEVLKIMTDLARYIFQCFFT